MIGLLSAAVGLRAGAPPSRRDLLVGGALSSFAATRPASAAGEPWDLIGAYNFGPKTGDSVGQIYAADGKPNTGILLLRETFDGAMPREGLLKWYEAHLADDFQAIFNGGKVTLDKTAYLAATADLLKSFPDFAYTRVAPMAYNNSPTEVVWTAVVKGTLTGAPYSPLAGVPTVAAKGQKCENDPEKIALRFASGTGLTQIKTITVEPAPGGKGFSGPVGFYLQAGGDPAKLPAP